MELTEKRIDSSYVYEGKIIKMRVDTALLPNGERAKREVVEHNGGVCVVPVDENGDVYLVRQFRYPYMTETLEVPAGKRDGDEQPLCCGVRELKEEIGASAKDMTELGMMYPSPGYCGEKIWMYLAKGLTFSQQSLDDDEFINVEKMPLKKAVDMAMNDEIHDAKTIIALLKTARMMGI